MVLILPSYKESAQRIVHSGSIFNLWNQMKEVFARKPEFLPNKIPDSCWLLSASGHLVSLSCSESLNWNYWLTRITEQRLILFQILKSYWNDFLLYNKEFKMFECGDQIIPIPNQRNNCNVCLRLRKEIPVNSARIARICSTPNFNEFLNFDLDIPTSCSILFTDFRTVFVFAVGHFLPLVVKFCRQCAVLKGY